MIIIKNFVIIPSFLAFLFNSYANDSTINKIDSLGQKQGYWVEYESRPIQKYLNISVTLYNTLDTNLKKHPVIIEYDFNDFQLFVWKGTYRNNYKEGTWIINGQEGQSFRVNYMKGIMYGEFEIFYKNGNLKMKGVIDSNEMIWVETYNEEGEFLDKSLMPLIDVATSIYD